jgi:ornithine cyclodeaminase
LIAAPEDYDMTNLNPSALAMVPFVSVQNMMRIVNSIGARQMMRDICAYIEVDFARWPLFDKTPRLGAHSEEGVIELMPTSDGEYYGFKYVNGHPANLARGFQTVTAFGVLARVSNGYPVLFSEMTVLTALRTAATSALAAKYLAPKRARTMALYHR